MDNMSIFKWYFGGVFFVAQNDKITEYLSFFSELKYILQLLDIAKPLFSIILKRIFISDIKFLWVFLLCSYYLCFTYYWDFVYQFQFKKNIQVQCIYIYIYISRIKSKIDPIYCKHFCHYWLFTQLCIYMFAFSNKFIINKKKKACLKGISLDCFFVLVFWCHLFFFFFMVFVFVFVFVSFCFSQMPILFKCDLKTNWF